MTITPISPRSDIGTVSWIVNGVETFLDDPEHGLYLLGVDGLGLPDFARFEERGPLQDGVTDMGFRYDARKVNIALGIYGVDVADLYVKRAALISKFKPSNTPGILRIVTGSGVIRQLDAFMLGGLSNDDRDRDYTYQKNVIALKCPDPAFYDLLASYTVIQGGGGGSAYVVNTPVPFTIGSSILDASESIPYDGSYDEYPIIRIIGPVTNPSIVHNLTGDKLAFGATTIAQGDWYEIDTRYGVKTVKDSSGVNKIGELSNDSDLATFRIIAGEDNVLSATGSSITSSTMIEIVWHNRYLGI